MPSLTSLVVVVERLDGMEVAVDDDVEEAIEQERHPVGGQVGRAVPALQHGSDREPVVLADGDEPAPADERVDLCRLQDAVVGVHADGLAGQEQVGGVAVELGALVWSQGVLHGELVQAELAGEGVELLPGGGAQVDPDHRVPLVQVLGDVGDGEARSADPVSQPNERHRSPRSAEAYLEPPFVMLQHQPRVCALEPRRRSGPTVQDRTRSQPTRRSRSDQRRCQRRPRRPVLTTPTADGAPPSFLAIAW